MKKEVSQIVLDFKKDYKTLGSAKMFKNTRIFSGSFFLSYKI